MGTRNLIAVMVDGQYKIAQYGQWDGYPSGQGRTALGFLKRVNMERFKDRVRECQFLTQEECDKVDSLQDWRKDFHQLSRDLGAKILSEVNRGVRKLANSISFAKDSLFCEWAYVVDFDKGTFEIYNGFNKTPIKDGRFVSTGKEEKYHPVKLLKSYSLDNLPGLRQFYKDCGGPHGPTD